MPNTKTYCSSIFLVFMASFLHSYAYQFNVGGRAGWIPNPPEDYNHWAGRMRFQVNDTLFFKYEKGSNSVLEVNKDDYSQCNVNNPILKLEDGNSIFKFDRSGPFYFISGNKTFCDQGQKIITVVLAIRHKTPSATPPPALAPGSSPALTPSPFSVAPSISPSPAATPPGSTPAPTPSPSFVAPSISPSPATPPASNAPTPQTSPSPTSPSPPSPPSSDTPPLTPPGSVTPPPPGGNSSGNSNSLSGASARPAFTPLTVLVSAVTIVFSVTLTSPIFF